MAKRRREEEKKIEKVVGSDSTVLNKIYIALGIIGFILVFYLLTIYITSREDTETNNKPEVSEEAVISYEEIIIGRSLSMGNDEYLVLFYDKSDEAINSQYSSFVTDYKAKEDSLKIYTVNMGLAFNSRFVTTKESNKNPNNAEEILINGPTLMKVKEGKVIEYFEGEEAISNYLK